MKRFHTKMRAACVAIGILLCGLFVSTSSNGQSKYQSAGAVKIIIEGTSNIHDWDMKSDKGTCTGVFAVNNSGLITSMSALNCSVPAETLKSEHKGMDKNTYKALHTDQYASISFTAGSAEIKRNAGSGFTLTTKGKLTISGVTKDVILTANGVVNADKTITYSGSYGLKMTDYNVKPPNIMLGAIKTGNDLVVKFNMVLKTM